MSKFIARIQLNSANESDYETLNKEIEKDSPALKRRNIAIKADKKKKGEYNYSGNISLGDVVNAVYKAIKKTGRNYSFTVMRNKDDYKLHAA